MSGNNTTTAIGSINISSCSLPYWFESAQAQVSFFAYSVMVYFHLFATTVPLCISAVAFCRRYADEVFYSYYRIYIVNMAVHSVCLNTGLWVLRRCSGVTYQGADWFMSNYVLMWLAGRLMAPVVNMLDMIDMFLLISMAVDRLLAVSIPLVYRTMNHRRCVRIGASISYLIGIGASLYDIPRYSIVTRPGDDNLYHLTTNGAYTSLPVVSFLTNLRNFLNIAGLFSIVVLNLISLRQLIRLRKTKVIVETEARRDREKRKVEHNLLIMSISQGCVLSFEKPLLVADYIFLYSDPTFVRCGNLLMSPVMEFYLQVCDTGHLVVLYVFSMPFRRLLLDLPFVKRLKNIHVKSTSNAT